MDNTRQAPVERLVAKKVRLNDLTGGTYVRVEGEWEPNFIQTGDGRKFSRVNVIAVVASEPTPDLNFISFVIDDGSARLPVRIFGENKFSVNIGDIALIIGKPREFSGQVYIVPEIIKKIENKKWIDYRKLELGEPKHSVVISKNDDEPEYAPEKKILSFPKKEEQVSAEEVKKPGEKSPIDELIDLINTLDKGEGADTEEVIAQSKSADAEKLIESLLKEGEIFEITSGKIKVLE